MKNIKRTLIAVTVATLAIISVPTTAEAAKKEKVYKANVNGCDIDYYVSPTKDASHKKGEVMYYNGGELDLDAGSGVTLYYNYKTNTTKVSTVKAPTTKSKKIKANKEKTFKITKNTVIKFKVVKGKATKTKVKKAKTYYVVCKVQNKTDFMLPHAAYTVNSKYGTGTGLKYDTKVCDKVEYTVNGGKKQTAKWGSIGAGVYGPTTIQVTGYKMGKKLGTYTYNYDVKKYAPKEMHNYVLKGSLPNEKWINALTIPYGDGYAVAYTLDGSTPSLKNGKFVTEFKETTYDWTWGPETGCFVEYLNQYGTINAKVQVYKKMYYKNTNNKYVFAGYEPVGDVQAKTYKTFQINENLMPCPNCSELCADPAYMGSIDYMSYIAPTEQAMPHLTKMQVTYIDVNGYMVTVDLKPGQKLTDVHTKAQRCSSVVTFYVDGENVYEEVMQAKVQFFISQVNSVPEYWVNGAATYQDYLDSFTNHPRQVLVP